MPGDPVEDYLAALPSGLGSFPEATVRGPLFDQQLDWIHDLGLRAPPVLAPAIGRLRASGSTPAWVPERIPGAPPPVPEVLGCALGVFICRRGYPSVQMMRDDFYRRQRAAFRKPFYAPLVRAMGPSVIVLGASERWRALRRGTRLTVERSRRIANRHRVRATLTYPPGLFAEENVLVLLEGMRAMIDEVGGRDSAGELSATESRPGSSVLVIEYSS